MGEHGSAAAALDALPKVAEDAGVSAYAPCSRDAANQELKAARLAGAEPLACGDQRYPALLAEMTDAPPLLWALGDVRLLSRPAIGIVGARNATSLGLRMTRALAGDLGKSGHVVVSGMARGIDTAAHEAALETGTIAIFAGGVDVVYPKDNAVLAQQIAQTGLRLSEHPPGLTPKARHFLQRNRLISGLSRALIVVEAAARSGSLITAGTALDQGREVMAVPGHPFDARASGCNMLLRDGAVLIRSAADVLEALQSRTETGQSEQTPPDQSPPAAETIDTARRDAFQLHRDILGLISPSPVSEDQLIRDLKLPASIVSPAIMTLEMEGKILRQPGGKLASM